MERERPGSAAGPGAGEADRVARAAAGDAEALEALLREHGPRVRAGLSIGARLRRELDPDDVMQVTYLEAYLRVGALRESTERAFAAWLARVAENNLRDAVRGLERDRRGGAERRVTRGADGEGARTLLARVAASTTTAGSAAARRDAGERLRDAVARLPRSYREVVQACDLDERPVREVAAERGTTPGAVHMVRSRAHERLRELLGGPAGTS